MPLSRRLEHVRAVARNLTALRQMLSPFLQRQSLGMSKMTAFRVADHCGELPEGAREADLEACKKFGHQHGGRTCADQTSVPSASTNASSTSTPRYRTVVSIFVWPNRICTARRLPVCL